MDRNKILDDIEEIFELCQDRNIGSNETELDIKETITDYIVKKLTLTDVSQQRKLLLAYNEEVNQCMVDSQDVLNESDVDEFIANNCG